MLRVHQIIIALGLVWLGADNLLLAQQDSASQLDTTWYWNGRDQLTHVVVVVLDKATGRVRQVYIAVGGDPPCGRPSARADSSFLRQAQELLQGVGWSYVYPGQQEVAPFGTEFVSVSANAGDLRALVLFHRDGGLVFAGSSVWSGTGRQFFPSEPVDPWRVREESSSAPPPDTVSLVAVTAAPLLASVRHLSVVHAFARRPYRATVFEYRRSVPFPSQTDVIVLLTRPGRCWS